MRTRLLTLLLAVAAALPAAASASSISLDGNTLVLRAARSWRAWLAFGEGEGGPGLGCGPRDFELFEVRGPAARRGPRKRR